MADEVLQQGVRGITDLMVMPGLINLDFADVRSVMGEMGKAMMGTGESSGDNRAIEAAEKAIANPLLDGVSMRGAKGVIISITGGEDMRLMEVDEAANHIKELVDPDANIIWGSAFNNDLEGKIRVSVVATGIEADASKMPEPAKLFSFPPARKAAEPAAPRAAEPAPVPPPAEVAPPAAAAPPPPPPAEPETGGDELLLGEEDVLSPSVSRNPLPPQGEEAEPRPMPAPAGTRRWLTVEGDNARPAAPAAREGGTLFERMSNIARGAAKAQVEEEAPAARTRDPLEVPRFLNRQNNQ